jgi:predicted nuclease of predicted toxin-antitoxin system
MKLLFDQNISYRLIRKLEDIYPDCTHVRKESLENASDLDIWNYARSNGYSIVTFDADFYDLATLKGHPPKIIWIRVGNTSTINLEKTFRIHQDSINEFLTSEEFVEIGCLEIE